MSALRRQHGGRDFLLENKNNVSRMEANSRCLAAANARRVPLWRPVVLHYPEKLRPHGLAQVTQRRQRQWHAPHEAPEMRSGLAHPYGFKDDHRRRQPPPCVCEINKRHQRDEERCRIQGGWIDPRREQKLQQRQQELMQRKCTCHDCYCHSATQLHEAPQSPAQAPAKAQAHIQPVRQAGGAEPERVPPPTEMVNQGQAQAQAQAQAQGQTEAADRNDDRNSRMDTKSVRSEKSTRSIRSIRSSQVTRSQAGNNEAQPLSARSQDSNKTLRSTKSSKRSPSQESIRSNATIKSKMSVASKQSNASKKSIMEVMPLPHSTKDSVKEPEKKKEKEPQPHEGYTPLTTKEKEAALQEAHYKYGKLIEEYNHLPVSEPTLRVRSRKIAIERQLDELDYAINMFDQPHMDMYYRNR